MFDYSFEKSPSFWRNFNEVSKIPRGSGNELAVRDFLYGRAKEADCEVEVDSAGNLLIRRSATTGFEKVPAIILQGHMDMVCEREEGSTHDFARDPLFLKVVEIDKERWLQADGTTLGADNGFALAVGLTLLEEKSLVCGSLEMLFTVAEETGLTGAMELDASFLRGKRLINLDSEEEGIFCIGCAGGKSYQFNKFFYDCPYSIEIEKKRAGYFYQATLSGLQGGHSGIEIDKGRANAIQQLLLFLSSIKKAPSFSLISFESIFRHNVIPSRATATFMLDRPISQSKMDNFLSQLIAIEPATVFQVKRIEPEDEKMAFSGLSQGDSQDFISTILALPCGPTRWATEISGLVETSGNVATLVLKNGEGRGEVSLRSLDDEQLKILGESMGDALARKGWNLFSHGGYPGWKPSVQSSWVKEVSDHWKVFTGVAPELTVIHAGLECGILGKKIKECEMISLGPDIKEVHSPKERMSITSAEKVYAFVKLLISSISLQT